MLSTPILNPPQSGILGLHAIKKRPAVVNDEIAVRPMMYLAMSYDHRLVDGTEAVTFLKRIVECIENPERLGLAQLHQLRGRVGRGSRQSSCVLLYQSPLSDNARERLAVLRETGDGFEIARRDMELRGPGEVLGTRQTGEMQFHIADLLRDETLLEAVEAGARQLLEQCPQHATPLIRRWLGEAAHFGEV